MGKKRLLLPERKPKGFAHQGVAVHGKNAPLVWLLCVALLGAVALAFWQYQEAQAASLSVRTGRERAYYSALDALTNLEADLSKALIASGPGQHALLLGRAATLSAAAGENLSTLPAVYGADEAGLKFLSQTGDYAQTLAAAAAEGRTLTSNDLEQLARLLTKSGELRRHLESGAGFSYDESTAARDLSGIEYPALLYDGPFSDGIRAGAPRGLGSRTVTAEEAVAIARAFVDAQSAQRAADMVGPIPCWGVSALLSDLTVTVQVTRQGGNVLWMAPETAGFTPALDIRACKERAAAFLLQQGFGEMEASFAQQYDGLAVISFAAVQDGVLLYPDLVKVQVRMDTGDVVGLEANNYWMNHVARENLTPSLSESEARLNVSGRLTVTASRLCVIPVDDGLQTGVTEKLCWEFDGTWSGSRYLIYIDARTGDEIKVLKEVAGNGGTMTI